MYAVARPALPTMMSSPPSPIELVGPAVAEEDVVADDRVVPERVEVVAGRAVRRALLEPVVALVAHVLLVGLAAEDEVVARAAEGLRRCPRR